MSTTVASDPIVVCHACGAKNRLPALRRGRPVCGRCGTPMPGAVEEVGPNARSAPPVDRAKPAIPAVTLGVVLAVAFLGVAGLFAAAPSRESAEPAAPIVVAATDPPQTSQYGKKVREGPEVAESSCASPPRNGRILFHRIELLGEGGHTLEINNGSGTDAIVKVRHPTRDETQLSFFVANGSKVTLEGVPDGSYRVVFAFGSTFDAICKNFNGNHGAQEFPGITTLAKETTSTEIVTSFLSYTLHPVPSGNIHPNEIPAEVFDRD